MPERDFLERIRTLSSEEFVQVCKKIVLGLGFTSAQDFSMPDVQGTFFKERLIRESTDKMFRLEETWLLIFMHPGIQINNLEIFSKNAQSSDIQNILTVIFGEIRQEDAERYHVASQKANIRSVLISNVFTESLLSDFVFDALQLIKNQRFSFARLRKHLQKQISEASWHALFQTLKALPVRVSSINFSESVLDEADLFRAMYKTGSFLLLGDPGAGKTTSLQELAGELAQAGARTPLYMPLNRYTGNLLKDLGELLNDEITPLSEEDTSTLLSSGALVVILDGINEVRFNLRYRLSEEINHYTKLDNPLSRSTWIVSGRKFDYITSRPPLQILQEHTWELLPLTPDLIYSFLADGLGKEEGKDTYDSLGSKVLEICSNPLLLNMLLTTHQKTGKIVGGRGALYQQFIDLLLRQGADTPALKARQVGLGKQLGIENMSFNIYRKLAYSTLSKIAHSMQTTTISWSEAEKLAQINLKLDEKSNGAAILLDDLITRGILKYNNSRVSFIHHTFQEFFQAINLKNTPLHVLIPHGGVPADKREALIFLVGIIESPNGLIERALDYDIELAYEIFRDANVNVDKTIQLKLAKKIWWQLKSGVWVGQNKRWAQAFKIIAINLNLSPKELLKDILNISEERVLAERLLELYQELDDLSAQQETLKMLGLKKTEDIPNDLLFRMAITARAAKEYQRSLELYGKYIELNPNTSAAYGNRALVYWDLNKYQEARSDFEKSIDLNPSSAVTRSGFAGLLIQLNAEEEATSQLESALLLDPIYPEAHFRLGKLIQSKEPEKALSHFEQATIYAANRSAQVTYLEYLLETQEELHYFVGAMKSLSRLIELNPTSTNKVNEWKKKIARFRQSIDEIDRRRSIREKLQELEDIPLAVLAWEILKAAGWQIEQDTLQWLLATHDRGGRSNFLLVVLLDVPQLTSELVKIAIDSLPEKAQRTPNILLLTTAEMIDRDTRKRMIEYQSKHPIALISSVEAHNALLQGDRYCHDLIAGALARLNERDPFKYTTLVKEKSEFFGRTEHIKNFISLIQEKQLVALYGIHKIGKSSLLLQVRQNLIVYSPEVTPIWIEMSAEIKTASDLYRSILEKLPRRTAEYSQSFISANEFRHAINKFQEQKQREYSGHQVLVILDEYPYLIPHTSGKGGIKDYMEVLGMFKVFCQEGWFSILPCGRTTALSRTASWEQGENPLIGMLQEQFLEPLTQQETEELVDVIGFKAGISFDEDALKKVFELTGGHPFLTRTLGSWILGKQRRDRVNPELVEDTAKIYLRQGGEKALLLKIYYEELEEEERRVAKQLAISNRPLFRLELVTDDLNNEQGRRQVRDAIQNLLDTSVLQEDEQGRLSHRFELLRRAIEQEIKELEMYNKDNI